MRVWCVARAACFALARARLFLSLSRSDALLSKRDDARSSVSGARASSTYWGLAAGRDREHADQRARGRRSEEERRAARAGGWVNAVSCVCRGAAVCMAVGLFCLVCVSDQWAERARATWVSGAERRRPTAGSGAQTMRGGAAWHIKKVAPSRPLPCSTPSNRTGRLRWDSSHTVARARFLYVPHPSVFDKH